MNDIVLGDSRILIEIKSVFYTASPKKYFHTFLESDQTQTMSND